MGSTIETPVSDVAGRTRRKIGGIYAVLAVFNLSAWVWAFVAFRHYPALVGTAFLAYSLGLRHAVDADHIAAIDNVTRKLMQEGKQPLAAGLFFSLGHSTVVVLASIGVAIMAAAFRQELDEFHAIGGAIGTSISAAFLLLIATINIVILINVYRVFRRVRNGAALGEEELTLMTAGGGGVGALCGSLFRLIEGRWHMYPLGFLFGLGFDTASDIGLLGIAAAQASSGLPIG